MEDVTLSWPGSMTTDQAKKYLLTSGFVAVELFQQQIAQSETQHQCALSGSLRECLQAGSLLE